jgi:CelD/BcsL family acetyltransferase involved in cellulose biosynthesis
LSISILNPLEYPDWDALLETSDQSTFFQTAAWARVLTESYGYRPLYFTAVENGRLAGLIPVMVVDSWLTGRRGVSLPFTDLCHPVAQNLEDFARLFQTVVAHGRERNWKYLELRGGSKFLAEEPSYARHFAHTLELSADESEVRKRFKPNTVRNIRKAEKEGLSVSIEHSREAMAEYYRLHCGTRKHHGLPPQPWSFFYNIFKFVVAAGRGFIALAAHAGKTIAGAVYAVFRGQAIYKYGASDRSLQHLRPNNLVMWEAIRWSCRNGIRSFDFGRTEPENEGLLQFKRGWGTIEEGIHYYKYNMRANVFVPKADALRNSYPIIKRLPVPLLKLAGELMYRHVG